MRAIELAGLHAYSDQISVEAGERIAFHVSASIPYTVSLCRLGPDTTGPSQDEVLTTETCNEPVVQPIHPGSCIHVKNGIPAGKYPGLTFECWTKIWGLARWQTIFSQMDQAGTVDDSMGQDTGCGMGLFADPDGHIVLRWSEGILRSPKPVPLCQWMHVAATFNDGQVEIWLDGICAARSRAGSMLVLPGHPLRLGACGVQGRSDLFLEGDLAMPALYSAALTPAAIMDRVNRRALAPPDHPGLICYWPLNELRGSHIQAHGAPGYDGVLRNHGTRGINGPAFNPAEVPRYRDHALTGDGLHAGPDRAGVRFASDDLVDCGWSATHEFTVPAAARSGLYVGRFEFNWNGAPVRYDVTFVVKRARQRPAPRLLVLCATNSWMAYSASPFADTHAQPATWPRRCAGLPTSNPLVPTHCTYNYHRAGQPSYYVGVRMPRPNAAPYELYAPEDSGFAQWVRLERQLHVWLDRHGYEYDLVADIDLHRNPGLLQDYRAVIINGHSEYWSGPAYQGIEDYLGRGGHVIVLSGNSMYWRVSFNEDCTVMEQRKTRTPHDGQSDSDEEVTAPAGPHGEQYHSQDGQRGGCGDIRENRAPA
ncbi:N,N-dimethylformamidase beta subunit family domain-containing protein [Ottowia sp. VDI28]|uniref:N,N-dimethylformamidase beta subunit family domain-containing protein n=1 Tax=Ottowia sp. VDI28 TaxID=3133968 RepID=UPI003C2B8D8D